MSQTAVSVVIPTRDRAESLKETLASLREQSIPESSYEVVVVDDGSSPPLPSSLAIAPNVRLIRLAGGGRSAARNAGAAEARSPIIVFVDDDMTVVPDFLAAHVRAHDDWPGSLVSGRIRLPPEALRWPFGQFRQRLESMGEPSDRGPLPGFSVCSAQNMSLSASSFAEVGGFDASMSSSEDQDLGHRHLGRGGRIVYIPEALAIHRDWALDVRAYCHRMEWGYHHLIPFCRRYPALPETRDRDRVNGPTRWGGEPIGLSLRKSAKAALASRVGTESLFAACRLLERIAPGNTMLDRLYRASLGVHIQRGYRAGLHQYRSADGPGLLEGADRPSHQPR